MNIDELLAQRSDEQGQLELELCRVVLSDAASCTPVAVESGVNCGLFQVREDCRLMFSACMVAGDRGDAILFHLIRKTLAATGYWTKDAPSRQMERAFLWHEEKLVQFSMSWEVGPSSIAPIAVRAIARDLGAVHGSIRDAFEHYSHAVRLLEKGAA